MFHKVRILNQNGKLLKVITSEALSKRHWKIFEDQLKPSFVKTSKFRDSGKNNKLKNDISTSIDGYSLGGVLR